MDARGQPPRDSFLARIYEDASGRYPYQVYVPRDYDPVRRWPVVLALHGTGEIGTDGVRQAQVGVGRAVRQQRAAFPAVVVLPQVPQRLRAQGFAPIALAILDQAVREFNGDPDRLYLTGLSYGGTEGFNIALAAPGRFAAFVEVSGGICRRCVGAGLSSAEADAEVARRLRSLPLWVLHGELDPNIPVTSARALVAAFRRAGAQVRYTEYAGAGHEVWDRAYADSMVWGWLFAHRRGDVPTDTAGR